MEFVILYGLNVLVVIGYFLTASLSFFVLREVNDFHDYKSKQLAKTFREIFCMTIHKGRSVSEYGSGRAALYSAASLFSVSCFAFALLNLKYLLDGDIVYIGPGTTLAWFLAHFAKMAGTSLVWFAVYKALRNERRTRTVD